MDRARIRLVSVLVLLVAGVPLAPAAVAGLPNAAGPDEPKPILEIAPEATTGPQEYADVPVPAVTNLAGDPTGDCGVVPPNHAYVTIPDDTRVPGRSHHEKQWLVYNCGTTTWDERYRLVHIASSGVKPHFWEEVNREQFYAVPVTPPGRFTRIRAAFTAPWERGPYVEHFELARCRPDEWVDEHMVCSARFGDLLTLRFVVE